MEKKEHIKEHKTMAKKKRSEMSFSELLQDTIDKHNKRAQKNAELFRAAQKKQGKSGNEPINLFDL